MYMVKKASFEPMSKCFNCISGRCCNKVALSMHYKTHGDKCIEEEEKGICSMRYVYGNGV